MNFVAFLFSYSTWHYTRGLKNLLGVLSNLFFFLINFFSIPVLASTLFSPWRRLGEERSSRDPLDIEDILSVMVVNTLMRLVGLVIRLVAISLGLLSLVLFTVVAILVVMLWMFWPLFIVVFILNGLYFVIR